MGRHGDSVLNRPRGRPRKFPHDWNTITHGPLLSLDSVDEEIVRIKLASPECTPDFLAAHLDIGVDIITDRLSKPSVKTVLLDSAADAEDQLKIVAKWAVAQIRKLIYHPDPKIQLGACKLALMTVRQHALDDELLSSPVRIYQTNIQPDGTLIQQIIDQEAKPADNKKDKPSGKKTRFK